MPTILAAMCLTIPKPPTSDTTEMRIEIRTLGGCVSRPRSAGLNSLTDLIAVRFNGPAVAALLPPADGRKRLQ
jgi:hypothetical protein